MCADGSKVRIRIGILDNWDFNIYSFRRELMRGLEALGEVFALCPEGDYASRLRAEGFRHIPVRLHRWVNPLGELASALEVVRICRTYRLTVVHSCSPKASVAGQLGAWFAGTPVRIMDIQGLGYSFSRGLTPQKAAIRALFVASMRLVSTTAHAVVFLNREDLARLTHWRIVDRRRAVLINSCGIDPQTFRPSGVGNPSKRRIQVAMVARLLREKGVIEYMEACDRLKVRCPEVECLLIGMLEPNHPSGVSRELITQYEARNVIKFLGPTTDIKGALDGVDVIAHPSYYGEGVPKVLLEAAAMEKAIVAADNVGTREVIEHERTGLLVPGRQIEPLTSSIQRLVEDPSLRKRLGQAARRKVERQFDVRRVVAEYVALYRRLLSAKGVQLHLQNESARASEVGGGTVPAR